MTIETLIEEMKAVKLKNPILEISDVLQIFSINALNELTKQIRNSK